MLSLCMSDVRRLSITYIGRKWRTEKPWSSKICTQIGHITRDSDTALKVNRSRFKVIGVGAYCGGLMSTLCFST